LLACIGFLTRVPMLRHSLLCESDVNEDVDGTAVIAMNKSLARLKDTADLALRYPALDLDTLHMVVYADSSFANRRDKSS
jgi:hypothetical protein